MLFLAQIHALFRSIGFDAEEQTKENKTRATPLVKDTDQLCWVQKVDGSDKLANRNGRIASNTQLTWSRSSRNGLRKVNETVGPSVYSNKLNLETKIISIVISFLMNFGPRQLELYC